jgi:hypothetical protein
MANGSNHLVSIVRPPPLLTWVVSQPQHHFNLPVYGSACVLEAHLAIEALGLYIDHHRALFQNVSFFHRNSLERRRI